MIEKYKLNENPNFVEYNILKEEIYKSTSILTGKTNTNVIDDLFHIMEDKDSDDINIMSQDISAGQNNEDNISSK